MHPSLIDKLLSGITKSGSICNFIPNPLQSGQAPYGALKLNSLGSNSGRLNSQWGHANCSEKTISFLFSPNIWITTFPLDNFVACSIASNKRLLYSSFNTILSITTSILSLIFFSRVISSPKSYISPFTRTLT